MNLQVLLWKTIFLDPLTLFQIQQFCQVLILGRLPNIYVYDQILCFDKFLELTILSFFVSFQRKTVVKIRLRLKWYQIPLDLLTFPHKKRSGDLQEIYPAILFSLSTKNSKIRKTQEHFQFLHPLKKIELLYKDICKIQ